MSIVPHDGRRTVYLPLKELDKCAACEKMTSLRLCSSCGERIYCSPECQKEDWPTHKSICGKTDRIDLTTFYPFLALLAESHRLHPDKPLHPALTHAILNSPNPSTLPTALSPDGTSAKLVILGEPVPQEQYASHRWWPTAASDFVRHKLFRRIGHEGYLIPVLTAVCVALLAEMYTTTYIPSSSSSSTTTTTTPTQRRTRLQYRSSPIADFGIATGPASVTPSDRLAYLNLSDDTFECGMDPSTHAWLYFTTVRGEEFALDLGGMFLFNLCFAVPADPYGQGMLAPVRYAPAYFRDRGQVRNAPIVMHLERRYSVLRDEGLGEAVRWSGRKGGVAFEGEDVRRVVEFMERVGGGGGRRKVSDVEMDLTMKWCVNGCVALGITMADRAWVRWPKEPMLAIETDPGEMDDEEEEEDGKGVSEEWFKYVRRWNKKYKKGQISMEVLGDMYRAWAKRQARAQGREKEEKEP